jgi:hypothetical protein
VGAVAVEVRPADATEAILADGLDVQVGVGGDPGVQHRTGAPTEPPAAWAVDRSPSIRSTPLGKAWAKALKVRFGEMNSR